MSDGLIFGIATEPPTLRQRRLTNAAMALMLVFYGALTPFAAIPLAPVDGFIPAVEGMISVADLVTAVFLFSQFSVSRSPALLMLACGYLFSALIVIPHILTFPGAFAPLGAGPQSAGWLYVFCHLGFPVAVIGYAILKNGKRPRRMIQGSTRTAIGWSVMLVAGLVCAITWLVTAHSDLLPIIFLDERTYITQANFFSGFDVLMGIIALLLLWTRRVSVLDQWLMVSICAFVLEVAVVTLLDARFNVGFYSSRAFSVISATVLLVVLLTEAIGLYARATGLNARLSQTLTSLQRERESKLLSLQAIGGAIAHEMNQPIAAIALEGQTALRYLKSPPNVEEARISVSSMVDEAFRASEVLKTIRDLFKGENNEMETVDGNAIVMEALHLIREDLKTHHIITQTELTPDLPHITGNKGQLLQVMLNLLHNAVEALGRVKDRSRVVRIETSRHGHDKTSIIVEDSGPGISPEMIGKVFDTFITTKSTGMGMGLSLCRMIVERHGGDIVASSSGSGARLQIILPAGKSVGAISA